MTFEVFLASDAARDLEDICAYVEKHDATEKADYVLDQIEQTCASLVANPHRGNCPRELLDIGLREYREILFKPYRISYRVITEKIYILVITDGRRDMQALLQKRLLHY